MDVEESLEPRSAWTGAVGSCISLALPGLSSPSRDIPRTGGDSEPKPHPFPLGKEHGGEVIRCCAWLKKTIMDFFHSINLVPRLEMIIEIQN